MSTIQEIFKMNNWTLSGLWAGFSFGCVIGMFIHDRIVTYFRKRR